MTSNSESYWTKPKLAAKPRLVTAIWGPPKDGGKTHFALTFPEPIYYFNVDRGIDELLPQFPNTDIRAVIVRAETGVGTTPQFLEQEYNTLMGAYAEALVELKKLETGTMVFDTFTQTRALLAAHHLGRIKRDRIKAGGRDETFQYDWEAVNNDTGGIIRDVYDVPGVNLVLIHREAPVYDARGNDLGSKKIQGWHGTLAAVGHIAYMGRDTKGFYAKIEGSRSGAEFKGMRIEDPTHEKFIALGIGAIDIGA